MDLVVEDAASATDILEKDSTLCTTQYKTAFLKATTTADFLSHIAY